jgi:hypothetical protein
VDVVVVIAEAIGTSGTLVYPLSVLLFAAADNGARRVFA